MDARTRQLMAALLALVLVLVSSSTAATDCSRHCYAGQVEFESGTVDYSVGYVPCSDTPDGQINQQAVATYECAKVADDLARLTFASSGYVLSWLYQTTDSCDALFDVGLGTFINATFSDAAAEASVNSDTASLEQVSSECGEDCAERCYSVPLLANDGLAGSSSPCGLENATSCDFVLQLTVVPCTGYITALDVLIGSQRTPLSVFDPAMLASPELQCLDDGQLQLGAEGLYVLWAPTSLPCDTLLSDLNTEATGGVQLFVMDVGGEQWSGTAAQGATTSLAMTVCQTAGGDDDDVDVEPEVEDYFYLKRSRHPVKPFVTCSHQIDDDLCCTVFGYHNPNPIKVWTQRVHDNNWFTPSPINRSQKRIFDGNATEVESFSIIWPCNKHEERVLTWNLRHPAGKPYSLLETYDADEEEFYLTHKTYRHWFRQARAIRTRNDCSASQREEWCIIDA